jgi:hypothetical protein
MNNIFSNLVSITKGLHRDHRSEREYQILLPDIKLDSIATNGIFKLNFKRPLSSKKQYYQKLIFNQTETEILSFVTDFPQNATIYENKYTYTVLSNKFDKYLNDIAKYVGDRAITDDLGNDDNYIIHYLKVSAIRLYVELQEQYGQYSEHDLFTIPEIAEKYFNDSEFDAAMIEKMNTPKIEVFKKPLKPSSKTKSSFGYLNQDPDWLLKILKRLQLSIDLLDTKTDVEDLHNLFIAKDIIDYKKEIYLDCKTTEFKYIIKKLQNSFKNLNPTFIESTGLFFTKSGKPLTAQNLYTKSKEPLKKEIIDNIFKQMQ